LADAVDFGRLLSIRPGTHRHYDEAIEVSARTLALSLDRRAKQDRSLESIKDKTAWCHAKLCFDLWQTQHLVLGVEFW
jgi:hypothetical protein